MSMKLKRLKKGSPYYVEWDDTMIRNDWSDNDTKDFLEDPPSTEFMGWYDGMNKKAYVFIMHRDVPPGKTVGERIKIPKKMMVSAKGICYSCVCPNTPKNCKKL